jgi:hypothetical protein
VGRDEIFGLEYAADALVIRRTSIRKTLVAKPFLEILDPPSLGDLELLSDGLKAGSVPTDLQRQFPVDRLELVGEVEPFILIYQALQPGFLDLLVEPILALAKIHPRFPELPIVIRPHPTRIVLKTRSGAGWRSSFLQEFEDPLGG